jgi:hypothetical protein
MRKGSCTEIWSLKILWWRNRAMEESFLLSLILDLPNTPATKNISIPDAELLDTWLLKSWRLNHPTLSRPIPQLATSSHSVSSSISCKNCLIKTFQEATLRGQGSEIGNKEELRVRNWLQLRSLQKLKSCRPGPVRADAVPRPKQENYSPECIEPPFFWGRAKEAGDRNAKCLSNRLFNLRLIAWIIFIQCINLSEKIWLYQSLLGLACGDRSSFKRRFYSWSCAFSRLTDSSWSSYSSMMSLHRV